MAKFSLKKNSDKLIGSSIHKSSYMTVKVSGLKELSDALAALDLDLKKRTMKKAGVASMSPVLTRVKAGLQTSTDTGGLLKTAKITTSMNHKKLKKRGRKAAMIVSVSAGRGGKRQKGRTGQQALQVEFGTARMAARPFMRPAIQGKEKLVFQRFRWHLKVGLDKAAKTQARRTARLAKKNNKAKL